MLYNSKNYLIINKPYDLRLEGDFPVTLVKYMELKYPDKKLYWIHRLDYGIIQIYK